MILVCGAGGFICGHLVRHLLDASTCGVRIRAVDKKPVGQWHQAHPNVENLCLDLRRYEDCRRAVEGVADVYQLAASMGGMGWISTERIDCMQNVDISVNMLEAAYRAGVQRYFFASSACVYPAGKQNETDMPPLKESDAYPAESERGYGWEKLYAEMLCQEYWTERGLETHIARFFNVVGPHETWQGGREKAPAAICRKVIEAKHQSLDYIDIWGDGNQTRNFTWVGDCVKGIDLIMHSDKLIATPCNLGSTEAVTINQLVDLAEEIGGVKLIRRYDLTAPQGVRGRNSDNTFIKSVVGWEPTIPLRYSMEQTYKWIEQQYMARAAGNRVIT